MTKSTKTQKSYDLELEEVEGDRLSRKVRKVTAHNPPTESMDELAERGQHIADKVTYLDEDLRVVEADDANEVVILRSDEPQSDEKTVEYYECQVKADGTTALERIRYHKDTTTKENADFVVTEKTLERLGRDLKSPAPPKT
jgi:hypothetical protein